MILTVLISVLAFAGTAEEELQRLHCKPAAVLRSEVQSCEGNSSYYEAASSCLKKFEESAARFQGQLAAVAAQASGQQLASEMGAQAKYSQSLSALDLMISTSERLKAEVLGYKSEVVLPDDLAAVESGSLGISDLLHSTPCYHLTQDLVDKTAEVFHFKGEELRWTRKIAQAQLRKAGGRASNLEAGTSAVRNLRAKGIATSAPKGGKSTITGVERDKAKRKQ